MCYTMNDCFDERELDMIEAAFEGVVLYESRPNWLVKYRKVENP